MISVCMAAYNGEKFILEQLQSILKQLSSEDEVIISDDGSKDRTCEVINSVQDGRIRLVINQGLHGFTHNFENALAHARGDYIFLADQDDVWMNDKVKITMKELENCDFTVSDCITVDSDWNVLQESRFRAFNIRPGFLRHLLKSRYLGCCMAFKRVVLDASLPFPKNDKLLEHDIWLAAVAFLYYKVKLINQPLIYYRRHGGNVSDGGFEKGYSLLNKIYRRIYRIVQLVMRRERVKDLRLNNRV